jgi:hypothetical protein
MEKSGSEEVLLILFLATILKNKYRYFPFPERGQHPSPFPS